MHPHFTTAIIAGFAIGAIIGYAFTPQIANQFPILYPKLIFVS